jgi:hypothetical protein
LATTAAIVGKKEMGCMAQKVPRAGNAGKYAMPFVVFRD